MRTFLPITWRRATLLATAALHGPFLLVALGSFWFISCSHCIKTFWMFLPIGPSVVPMELVRQMTHLPRVPEAVGYLIAALLTAAELLLVVWLIRRRNWTRAIAPALVAILSLLMALGFLAALRA